MKKIVLTFAFVFLFFESGLLLKAQNEAASPQIRADNQIIREDFLRAYGHVEIIWQDLIIYADVVEFNQKSRELFAEGRVTMSSKDTVLSGEKLKFNLQTKSGELIDTYGLLSPFVRYETDKLTQVDLQTLTFKRLDFSSCAQIIPRWKITGRQGKIKKEKYIAMKDVLFRIKNIPILYLPYLRYPITKDGRGTGFLFPGIGNSALRGFNVQPSFYWNIRPNIDMTLSLDYYSKLGTGVSDEVRYLFRKFSGSARFYYFKYLEGNQLYTASKDDYYLEADHQQTLPFLNSNLALQVKRQSRPDFLRLFDNNFNRGLSTNSLSSVSWTSSLANLSFSASASRTETFYTFSNDSPLIVENLPNVSISLNQQKLGPIPGYFSLFAQYQVTLRSGKSYENESEVISDFRSQRLSIVPSYQLTLLNFTWLNFSLNLQSQNAFYPKSFDPEKNQIVAEPLYLKYQTVNATLQGPIFSRLFKGNKRQFKHTIEPVFDFRYATKVKNSDRLIKVDIMDYPGFSYAGFSLTSRLLVKGADQVSPVSEILSLQVAQKYYFNPAEANQFRKVNGIYPSFSELSSSLVFRPNADLNLDATLVYNHYVRDFSLLILGVSYNRQNAPLTGFISFSSSKNPYQAADFIFNRSILRGGIGFDIPQFPFKFRVAADYDFRDKVFRYGILNASFDYQCMIFSAEVKLFYREAGSVYQGSPFEFRFGFSLGNLGMVSNFFGGK
ncbi:MAG: LPS assembly protein LptD [Chrysiogenales bacterium]